MASGSLLTNTKPPQVPTRASGSLNFSLSTWGKSHWQGSLASEPSSAQVQPWNGQDSSWLRPWVPEGLSLVPRCRQALKNALMPPSGMRVTINE